MTTLQCTNCSYSTTFQKLYDKHLLRHRFCEFTGCNYHTMNSGHFVEHLKKHTKEKPYSCTVCDLKFSQNSSLTQHLKTHNDEKIFPCTFENCDKTFSRNEHLKTHLKIHLGIKDLVCDFKDCDFSTGDSSTLVKHKRTHTGEKPYHCDQCDYKCTVSCSLITHLRTHSGEKPFTCTWENCTSKFSTGGALKYHIDSYHNKIKTHSCDFENCTYTCNGSGSLQSHLKTHSDDTPFHCTICNYQTKYNSSLTLHMRGHNDSKPFPCDKCDYKARQSQHLSKHNVLHHTSDGRMRMKVEEKRIIKLLEDNCIDFVSEHFIDFTCIGNDKTSSRCNIDFLVQVKDNADKLKGFVFLEVDENQHKYNSYTIACENRRMMEVFRTLVLEGNTLPIVFIRYNPNSFSRNDKRVKLIKEKREERLLHVLKNWDFLQDNGIFYMYYDTIDEEPSILEDPEYEESVKQLYIGCI
jgi:uncharacterized Zn-finger protein